MFTFVYIPRHFHLFIILCFVLFCDGDICMVVEMSVIAQVKLYASDAVINICGYNKNRTYLCTTLYQ